MAGSYKFGSPEFDAAAYEAGHRAFLETLAAGRPVFYLDAEGIEVMELPDGRRFETQWIPGAPASQNYRIVRELKPREA